MNVKGYVCALLLAKSFSRSSLLSQSTEESGERNGKTKDQSQGTLDQGDGDMDVRGRKRKPLSGLKKRPDKETREWDGKIGPSHRRWKGVNINKRRGGIR